MSVSSSWHRTGDAAGSYGWWGHLFFCGVWIQGPWPSCPAIISAWLAVPWWWEQLHFCCLVFFTQSITLKQIKTTYLFYTHCISKVYRIFTLNCHTKCVLNLFFIILLFVFYCRKNRNLRNLSVWMCVCLCTLSLGCHALLCMRCFV